MNYQALHHLAWKEFRAVRAFWLSLVALVLLAQGFIFAASNHPSWHLLIYTLALAAPAFFALGAAGTAFAIEREDGTFDFLRAAPVSIREILASKLALTVVATLAMYAVLWPVAWWLTGGQLPEASKLHLMLGLWLVAAAEAIAWGTLFSLASARPLIAICLAIAVGSTVTHLLASSMRIQGADAFDIAPYLAAAGRRMLVVVAVLAVDLYLGLRWLDGGGAIRQRFRAGTRRFTATVGEAAAPPNIAARLTAARWSTAPDRGAMFGHLLWQLWRQSFWPMAGIVGVYVWLMFVCATNFPAVDGYGRYVVPGMMAILAALSGCFVFRPDQERRRHRFFVEHNIPPRYVWLSRQAPWIVIVSLATLITTLLWIGLTNFGRLWISFEFATSWWTRQWLGPPDAISMPPVWLALSWTAVAFAAGQWASMMVRSGLLAGLVGIVLAAVLCAWTLLMAELNVSWWWSVAPILPVLLWATWLRAPDWARENTSSSARVRAGAVVLAPALLLLIAVPVHRVAEMDPLVSPGFDPQIYLADYLPEAKSTADLYRRANELYASAETSIHLDRGLQSQHAPALNDVQSKWLAANAEPLALVLKAAARPTCLFDDPQTAVDRVYLRNGSPLVSLVIASARQLEAEGKLDAALERYLAALDVALDLNDVSGSRGRLEDVNRVLTELTFWAAQPGQTPQQIRAAFDKLQAVDNQRLRLDDGLKSNYIISRRYVFGDAGAQLALFNPGGSDQQLPTMLWPKLMPWEEDRGLRALNRLTAVYLDRLRVMRKTLADGLRVVDFLPLLPAWYSPDYLWNRYEGWGEFEMRDEPWATGTLTPDLRGTNQLSSNDCLTLAAFEARRRGTMIVLAALAYRLEHGALPASLAELGELPHDPYSGKPFAYFPSGLPAPTTALEEVQLRRVQQVVEPLLMPAWPGVWCAGPYLLLTPWRYDEFQQPLDESSDKPNEIEYYSLRKYHPEQTAVPKYIAWGRGTWFPIPAGSKPQRKGTPEGPSAP